MHVARRSWVVVFVCIGFAAIAGAQELERIVKTVSKSGSLDLPAGSDRAEAQITSAFLSGAIRFLSDDLLLGRGAASRGDSLARSYIATRFEEFGLQPGMADGSWQQPFDIVGITAQVPETWSFAAAGGKSLALKYSTDFIANAGVQREVAAIENAEIVFVGYGMQAPEYQWDDFKGADLRGKVLLILNNDPDWDPKLFAGKMRLYYGRWDYKYESAARQGAAGAIIVHTTPSAGYPWQVVQTSWTGEQFELPAEGDSRVPVTGWVTEDAAKRLAVLGGKNLDKLRAAARKRDFRPVPLGVTTSLRMQTVLARTRTANVLGLLPGSDPALKHEVVVFTAHHDHLGVGKPDSTGDHIYNGAVDNAAGVATLLACARASTSLPQAPRRSVLFLAVGVEESGLLGSAYYAAHPTVQPGRIAANINMDGANIWGRTRDIALVGYGKSSMDRVAQEVALSQGRTVVGEQFPDRGYFYRSDQFSFAKIGVPALYPDNGLDFIGRPLNWGKEQIERWEARQYHQPSDEMDATWNLDGAVDDARFLFLCGMVLGNADEMPAWNAGDEFEVRRKAALSSATSGASR